MKISDVMKETGLTRKAIYYYEEIGLISPNKDGESSYRSYSESHLERLKQIKALRLLDVSLQQINDIFKNPLAFNKIMEKQLCKIKEKIETLTETENIINSLINDDGNSGSFSCTLDRLNHYLELGAKASKDYMKKELERIFPSGFGKLLAVLYGAFLDEVIDTKEKEQAWAQLINTLDATESVKFPDEINDILDQLYEQISKEGMDQFKTKNEKIINNIASFTDNIPNDEQDDIELKIQKKQSQEENSKLYEMSKILFQYIKDNPNILPADFSKYLKVLSRKYNDVSENFLKTFKSSYTIRKTFNH